MTARMATCHELTKNEADLKRIREVFTTLQKSSTPASLLLPWFPSPARKTGKKATSELYAMVHGYVEARRKADPTSDAIDVLIADGETTQSVVGVSFAPKFVIFGLTRPVQFVMAILFAGITNTGIICEYPSCTARR